MIRKIAAAMTVAMLSFGGVALAGTPAQAADDPYTNGVRTSCHVSVPAVVQVDRAPRIRITVRPNGPAPAAGTRAARAERPRGTVDVSITRGGNEIFSRTVAYNGSPVTVVGPVKVLVPSSVSVPTVVLVSPVPLLICFTFFSVPLG